MDPVEQYPFDDATSAFVKRGKASPKWRLAVSLRTQLIWQFTLFISMITIPLMPFVAVFIYFWSRAYVKNYHFEFLEDKIVVHRGVFTRRVVNIPYTKIQNVTIYQSFIDRMVGVYSVNVETAGAAVRQNMMAIGADASIQGLEDPEPIKDFIHWMGQRGSIDADVGVSFTSAKTRKDRSDIAMLRELQSISASLNSIESLLRAKNPKINSKVMDKHRVATVQCPYCSHMFTSKVGETVVCPGCGRKGNVSI